MLGEIARLLYPKYGMAADPARSHVIAHKELQQHPVDNDDNLE